MADDKDKQTPEEPELDSPATDESASPTSETTAPESAPGSQEDPADALSRTPEELEEERVARAAADTDLSDLDEQPEKKLPLLKRIMRKVNVYLLGFILLLIIAGAISLVTFLNSQKAPEDPTVENKALTTEDLKQLANTDTSVGNASQTLNIRGNAIIAGQTLTRGDLNVAGNFQTGGNIQTPGITVSGTSNLGGVQINDLQVATNATIQGSTTLSDLNVSGASTFGGAMTASQITVTRLIMSGNATLEIPNHIRFSGPTPSRTLFNAVLGNGGTSSINGSDTAGTVNVNSGNNPTTGCFIRVNFRQAFPSTPRVVVTPVGAAGGQLQFYVERNANNFSICSANVPPANQSFEIDYFVTY